MHPLRRYSGFDHRVSSHIVSRLCISNRPNSLFEIGPLMTASNALTHLKLTEKHRIACQQLLDWLPTISEPKSVVFAGSIIAGTAGPSSDLDVVVLHSSGWRRRVQRWFNGTPVEVFFNSEEWLRHSIVEGADQATPVMAHMIATGKIIFDTDGLMENIADASKELLKRGPCWSAEKLLYTRYAVASAVDDALDMSDKPGPIFWQLQALAVNGLVNYAFLKRNMYPPRPKLQLSALACIEPEATDSLCSAITDETISTAAHSLKDASHKILGVTGFFEWDSGQDDSRPSN